MINRVFWRALFAGWVLAAIYFGLDSFNTFSWIGLGLSVFGFVSAEDTDD